MIMINWAQLLRLQFVAHEARTKSMNSVGLIAAGAAAGALAMHCMSRAREQFEPGLCAVCGARCAVRGCEVRRAL